MRRSPGRAIGLPPTNGRPEAWASRCGQLEPAAPPGPSRSIAPSSAATRQASAVTGFVTDAQRNSRVPSPCTAVDLLGDTSPTATCSAGQPSTARNASTSLDTRVVERQRIEARSPQATVMGYSRAVRVGQHVLVGGTAPVMPEGQEPPADAYGQAARCLEIIVGALREAGAGPE